jgi:hypothetical protein
VRGTQYLGGSSSKRTYDQWDLAERVHREVLWGILLLLSQVDEDELEWNLLFSEDHRDEAAASGRIRNGVELEHHVEVWDGLKFTKDRLSIWESL